MIGRVLITLLSHYKRHPAQLVMLLVGLWVASALWSSVQAINTTAKESYARANALFSADTDQLDRRNGNPLTIDDYLTLRRAGLPVSPLLEATFTHNGTRFSVLGIDPFTLPSSGAGGDGSLNDFITPPWQTQLAPDTLPSLGLRREEATGATPTVAGQALPPLTLRNDLPPDTLIMDIAAASNLFGEQATLSLASATGALDQPPDGYRITRAANLASPEQLTDSFHLNLTALALLSLVVGLFIVQAALGLAMEQRLATLRTLRALGVPATTLTLAILMELLVFGILGASLGLTSGLWLAGKLLPDVASTISSLYRADVQQSLSLPWHYWLGSVAITLGGLLLAGSGTLWRAARLNVLALGHAFAWRSGYQRQLTRMLKAGGLAALLTLGLAFWLSRLPAGSGLVASFSLVAALLLTCALCLPPLLYGVLHTLQKVLRRFALMQWAVADMQLQLPRLSLAMVALLIALATNLGVSSMVGGFRLTFLEWLDQRLSAPLYINAVPSTLAPLNEWLLTQESVMATLPTARGSTDLLATPSPTNTELTSQGTVTLFGVSSSPLLTANWPLLDTHDDAASAWQALGSDSVFINEQMAIARALAPGDTVTLNTRQGADNFKIAAIYPDYGNPQQQILLTVEALTQRFDGELASIGVALNENADEDQFRQTLMNEFNLSAEALVNQQEVKRIATQIFERTFSITRALNGLTLGVAALALLATLLAQAHQRQRQLAALWALGVPRATLVKLPLLQLGGLALLTGLIALPLGIAITWLLVAVINVSAFGWRLPLQLFPLDIVTMLLTAIGVALLAAALPCVQLWRTSPRALLNEGNT
ncbi:ABC transporter permease [Halomonas sp. GFAJ-1]|uniref:ABC transporter permease n=1 Tax=Halomonas sp. GFAJ-1 TaxID=1118153 RepID=UPI00023A33D3|nr:ABC transporter permease [Halomonas sp. GFAJ-1]AVI62987.1 ABC transporter permease [Halomonas sp. GFAJ-1]EHK60295.1 ABC transporter permease [Halomonas sp. GFAJ-1]